MRIVSVLASSLALLRRHPVLFLPRFAVSILSSLLWLWLLHAATSFTPGAIDAAPPLVLFIVLLPIQVWVYNLYFFVVQQEDGFDMRAAARDGLDRLPQGLAGTLLPMAVLFALSIPASLAVGLGLRTGSMLLAALGVAGLLAALLAVAVRYYFVPVAAVLGDGDFRSNVRRGLDAAGHKQRSVIAITLLSFALLVATLAVEGVLKEVGVAGFVLGRLLSATVSVYLLVVNPELYLAPAE